MRDRVAIRLAGKSWLRLPSHPVLHSLRRSRSIEPKAFHIREMCSERLDSRWTEGMRIDIRLPLTDGMGGHASDEF